MKYFLVVIFILLITGCSSRENTIEQSKVDTLIIHDTIYIIKEKKKDWQKNFGLTHDPNKDSIWHKPVSYYLNDKELSPIAIEFYYGYIEPSDNGTTDELLKYVTTDNNKLRPFYRWCLFKTIQISDGALAEHIGIPARKYAEKFPKEFFEYMDSDSSGKKYIEWTSAINYSGYYDGDNYNNHEKIRKSLIKKMNNNCIDCDKIILKRINKLAFDCFNK